jgi:WD40 repeat protein
MTTPRLNQQLIDLQIEIDIATGKLHKIREALILETRIEEKLRIEYQIELTEQTLDQLNQRYDKLEEYLSNIGLKELPEADQNPYKSLAAFQEEDSEQFFGREVLVQELLHKYQQVKILPLLGPSGSGKSSVARAGLIPQLKQLDSKLQTIILTPTDVPLENLANHLAWLITQDPFPIAKTREFEEFLLKEKDGLRRIIRGFTSSTNKTLVILIDQFEEIYTLCKEKTHQTAFIENILTLNEEQHLSVKIILTLRSDFLGETQQHSKLNQLLAKDSVIVPAMNENELRDAISKPAELMGHPLDEATINLLLEQTEGRASALPLLQFALTQIWDNMSKGISAAQTLSECGGVGGALAKKAQEIFEKLPEEDQKVTRRIFLKLVQLGEGAKDTRRRTPLSEMIAQHDESSEKVKLILERFARQDVRLLSLATQAVENNCIFAEITHEALLDNWQLLQEWLKDGREAERFHRRVHEAAQLWQLNQRPIGTLWRSPDLDLLATFYASHAEDMTALEIDFFNSSREQQQHEINEKLKQQRRLKLLTSVALIVAVVAGFFYFQADKNAKEAEKQAEIALKNENDAKNQAKKAEEQKKLALESENKAKEQETIAQNSAQQAFQEKQNALEQRNEALKTQSLFLADLSRQELEKDDATIATLLALEGLPDQENNIERPFVLQAADSLYASSTTNLPFKEHRILSGVRNAIFSPDGQQILTSSHKNKTVKLWDKQISQKLQSFQDVTDVIFSPDSQQILTSSFEDKTIKLRDIQANQELQIFQDIRSAIFSPDGQQILTISFQDNTAKLWDKQTNQELQTFKNIGRAVFSPDSQQILTISSQDNTAKLWDKQTNQELQTFKDIGQAIFSPDSQQILTVSFKDNIAKLWDKQTNQELQTFQHVRKATFSPDGQQILTVSSNNKAANKGAKLWDKQSNKEIQTFQHDKITNAAFSPDNQQILTVSWENEAAKLWDKQTNKEMQTFQDITNATFSPDGQQILTISSKGQTVKLWNKQTIKEIQTFKHDKIDDADFSPDNQQILTVSSKDKTAKLWDKQTNKEIQTFQHKNIIKASFSPDNQQILTISQNDNDDIAKLWDKQTNQELQTFQGVSDAIFSPDGQQILITYFENNIAKLWDKQTNQELNPFEEMSNAIFSPDGQQILTISSGLRTASLFDKQTAKKIQTFQDATDAIFSPNGHQILIISFRSKTARLWDKQTNKELHTFQGVRDAIFSPDNQQILTISFKERTAKLWDKQTNQELHTFQNISKVIFSPNSQQILMIPFGLQMAKLWNKKTNTETQTFLHENIISADFSPDGQQILTISKDIAAKLWKIFPTTQELINYAKEQLPLIIDGENPPRHRTLTCEERQRFFLSLPKECTALSQAKETN